jgi:hypothetical protein
MTTFSQVADEIVLEHLRPDLIVSICSWLNETIREVHFDNRNSVQGTILYDSNRIEDEFVPATLPALWPIPSVPRFQQLETAFYKERGVYAKKRNPSRAFESGYENIDPYWYRTGPQIAFNGVHALDTVKLSWFEFPRRFAYYAVGARPGTYNIETDTWTYITAYDVSDATRQNAQDLTSNWLLLRWTEVLKEGVRAKLFKRQGEDTRAKMCFSQFEALKMGLVSSESYQMHE